MTFAAKWNKGWPGGSGAVLGFKVDTRDEVDALVAALAAEGVAVQQEPYDAFWGARYAVVSDPDGNGVGIMSPVDPAQRHEPASPRERRRRTRRSTWWSRSPRGAATSTSTTTRST